MKKEKQLCPICLSAVSNFSRYPNYICSSCASKAKSKNGRLLSFSNESLSGGFTAQYSDNGEVYKDGHICYIDNIKCIADEAKFGGIVIETFDTLICYSYQNI